MESARANTCSTASGTSAPFVRGVGRGRRLALVAACAHLAEQVQAQVSAALEKTRELSDDHKVSWTLTLVRTTAKYLLTACDRLRRTALQQAWSIRALTPAELPPVLTEVRGWDVIMRELSTQHGVIHPLGEMVRPLRLNDMELVALGVPCETLLNGEDLLSL